MEKDKRLYASLTTAFFAVVLMTLATNARADGQNLEKCFGVVKAGQNDCDTNLGSCTPSVIDASPTDWVYLPPGVCSKLVGGTTTAPATSGNSPTPGSTTTTTTTTIPGSPTTDSLGGAGLTAEPIMKDDTILDGGAGLNGGSSGNSPTTTPSQNGTDINKY